MNRMMLKLIKISLYSIVIFLIGFSFGNIKAERKNVDTELNAAESMFKVQGDKPEYIKATIDYMRTRKLKELGSTKREILSIWLPSLLVIVNIILTILKEKRQK